MATRGEFLVAIVNNLIDKLKGLESELPTRKIDLDAPGGSYQPSLFDSPME